MQPTVHLGIQSQWINILVFNNNFPSTSSHTSCFRLFFSAYFEGPVIPNLRCLDVSFSQPTKNYRNHGRKKLPQIWSCFCWKGRPFFHWTKKPSFHHQKIHWNQSKVHPMKVRKQHAVQKKLMVKTTWHNFLCQRVQHLPCVHKTLFLSPNLNKTCFVKSSKSSSTFFLGCKRKNTKTLGKPYPNIYI